MAWFVLLFVALVILGAVIWIKGISWAWETPPVPPPRPTPFITSAVATSAHTIHLSVAAGTGVWSEVEIERTLVDPGPSSITLFKTTMNELDDTGLDRRTLYRYRARFTTSPNEPWSDPAGQGKEARTF